MNQFFYVRNDYDHNCVIVEVMVDEVAYTPSALQSYLRKITGQENSKLSLLKSKESYKKYSVTSVTKAKALYKFGVASQGMYRHYAEEKNESRQVVCVQFVKKELPRWRVLELLTELNAPFLQAFCQDYELFKNASHAYSYACEYAAHYDEELDNSYWSCNTSTSFEVLEYDTSFKLVWHTRSGNELEFVVNHDVQEDEYGYLYENNISYVKFQGASSMVMSLFK